LLSGRPAWSALLHVQVKLTPPTSILQLTLIGFSLAVLPLIAALLHTMFRVDELSERIRTSIVTTDQEVQSSRILLSYVLSLERSAAQYLVLRDETVFRRYVDQRSKFRETVNTLLGLGLTGAINQRLKELLDREVEIYSELRKEPAASDAEPGDPRELPPFAELARPLPVEISQAVAKQVEKIEQRASTVQRFLLIQAVALIPLALLIGVTFSILITRPLRAIGSAIRILGTGSFVQPISVKGPQDIRAISDGMEWLRNRLNELDTQKLMFLQHVSHELKTPLTAIREGVELLHDGVVGELTEDQAEVAAILRMNSKQLQKQIEDLLKFNMALSQVTLTQRSPIRLRSTVEKALENHRMVVLARGLEIDLRPSDATVLGDQEQIRTVIDNLVSNAVNYSPDGGRIRIHLTPTAESVALDVYDQGPGVAPDERKRVFEAFYQGKHRREGPVKGTGLGLAIGERYAALHGGKIEILDSPRGAHFRLTLPLAIASAERQAADSSMSRRSTGRSMATGPGEFGATTKAGGLGAASAPPSLERKAGQDRLLN
jgi:two-component system sensor histidine kinase GlrK